MHFRNKTQGHYPSKTKKIKKKETTKEKILRVLKETAGSMSGAGLSKLALAKGRRRREKFATYMNMVDKLQRAKVKLPGRVELGNLTARSGKAGSPRVTNMSTIMDKYHDKALRMAQAKYYQKQLG